MRNLLLFFLIIPYIVIGMENGYSFLLKETRENLSSVESVLQRENFKKQDFWIGIVENPCTREDLKWIELKLRLIQFSIIELRRGYGRLEQDMEVLGGTKQRRASWPPLPLIKQTRGRASWPNE